MAIDTEPLEDAHLEDLAGGKTLERGRAYAASGAVTVVREDPEPDPALHARVAGTEDYSTSVAIEDGELLGECDCPSAGSGWFCKHMVAVALIWRHRLSGTDLPIDETAHKKVAASAKRAATVRQRRETLHAFLHSQSADALAKKLIDLADAYSAIERELKHWQKLAGAASKPEDPKPLLTELLTAPGGFIPWNEIGTWVRHAQAALPE